MYRNTASQKLVVFAWTPADGLPKSGDSANLTAYVSKDYGTVTVLTDTSASELDAVNSKGYYLFDLAQAETDADCLVFTAKSATSGVVCVCVPAVAYTGTQLGNVAHGGTAATVTAERVIIASTTATEPAVKLTGNTTGAGLLCRGGATGPGVSITTTAGDGLSILPAGGHAVVATGGGSNKHGVAISAGGANGHGISTTGGTSGAGLAAQGGSGGAGVSATAGAGDANAVLLTGSRAGAGLRCVGGAAATSFPGGPGAAFVGGAANANANGTAGAGLQVTGGQGAATLQGAAPGAVFQGGGTNTVASAAHGVLLTGTSTGSGQAGTFDATALASFFTTSSGTTYASAIAGSVVKEIVTNASGGGGGATAADIWSYTTRTLTAGTNIVLAKGTGLTGLNDLSAAEVNAECDTALADVGVTSTVTGRIDVATSTRLATASYAVPLDAAGTRTAVGLATASLDTQLGAISAKTTSLPAAPAAVGDVPTVAQMWGTVLTESYAADGAAFTGAQALYEAVQALTEFGIAGTVLTVKKRDGSTTAATYALNDAVAPSSRTRSA